MEEEPQVREVEAHAARYQSRPAAFGRAEAWPRNIRIARIAVALQNPRRTPPTDRAGERSEGMAAAEWMNAMAATGPAALGVPSAGAALVFVLAGLVKGVVGLGLPTVAIALLALWMPRAQAAALLIVPSLATNLWQMWPWRAAFPRCCGNTRECRSASARAPGRAPGGSARPRALVPGWGWWRKGQGQAQEAQGLWEAINL